MCYLACVQQCVGAATRMGAHGGTGKPPGETGALSLEYNAAARGPVQRAAARPPRGVVAMSAPGIENDTAARARA